MTRQVLSLSCYGVRCRVVEAPDAGVCARLRAFLPPEARFSDAATPDVQYDVRHDPDGPAGTGAFTVNRAGHPRWTAHSVVDALCWLRADIDSHVALLTRVGLYQERQGDSGNPWAVVRSVSGKPGPPAGEVRLGWTAEKGCYVKRAFVRLCSPPD